MSDAQKVEILSRLIGELHLEIELLRIQQKEKVREYQKIISDKDNDIQFWYQKCSNLKVQNETTQTENSEFTEP